MISKIKKITASQVRYNNQLFKNLIPIYDTVGIFLIPVRRRIVRDLKLSKQSRVLDVACGTGTQAILLAKKGYHVTGVDLSTAMLKKAKLKAGDNPNITFIRGDATKLPFKSKSFDASTISFGLHDMPENIRVPIIREMKRVTKTGGQILIADYATPSDGIVSKIERPISNLFESKYFESFMDTGLNFYLDKAKLLERKRAVLLMGIAQLVSCINRERYMRLSPYGLF